MDYHYSHSSIKPLIIDSRFKSQNIDVADSNFDYGDVNVKILYRVHERIKRKL